MNDLNDPNRALLELVAQALGPVCEDVVFVGGCATGLLLTQARPDNIRITEDVDIIAHALTARDYHALESKVRARGFSNDMRPGAPICRWVFGAVTLDVMPTVPDILGFANRWYPLAVKTADAVTLNSRLVIRLIHAPVFIATKLEAFKDRGHDTSGQPDYLGGHDLEDIITVVDRRPELLDECAAAPAELRAYLADEFSRLLGDDDFNTSLAGHLPGDAGSQSRLPKLRDAIRALAKLEH
jgi:predicted nucleotidyltransferase